MRARSLFVPILLIALTMAWATACKKAEAPAAAAPAVAEPAWTPLFAADLSDAEFPAGVWTGDPLMNRPRRVACCPTPCRGGNRHTHACPRPSQSALWDRH